MDNIDISDKFGIAMRINTRSLASLCMKNTDFSEICRNEDFWRAKYQQDFGLRDYRNRPVTGSWLEDYKRGEDRLDDYKQGQDEDEQDDDDLVQISGHLTDEGVECQALRGDDGKLYTLTGDIGEYKVGDRVQVQGNRAQISFCMQGITIAVTDIKSL
jgi:hypothetical protein